MQVSVQEILKSIRAQILFAGILGLLILQFLPLDRSAFFVILLSDVLILILGYAFTLNILIILKRMSKKPIELVQYILFLSVALFVLLFLEGKLVSGSGLKSIENLQSSGLVLRSIHFTSGILLLFASGTWFVMQSELFFLKQRRNLKTYYQAMLVFILLSALTAVLNLPQFDDYQFIHIALFVNTIILITINSFRIAWIAFLDKAEKKRLLLLSVGIIVLSVINLVRLSADEHQLLEQFSPSVYLFGMLISIYGIVYFGFLFFTTLFHLPTAEAFDRKTKEISSMQYFSRLINQALDPGELSETASELALTVCGADAAWLITGEQLHSVPVAPKNIRRNSAGWLTTQIMNRYGTRPAGTLFYHPTVTSSDESVEEKFQFVAVRPLKSHSRINGYLFTARKANLPYDSEEISAFDTFSDYLSIALENSHLLSESIEKERLERELDVAREIQKKLIPAVLPSLDSMELSALFIPAFEVGGDYYDFFELGGGNTGFVIADVSGKGISAAFIMAETRGIFASLSRMTDSPKNLMIMTNQILRRSLDRKHFVTAVFGSICHQRNEIKIVRAGHLPVLRLREGLVEEITPGGIGLGLHFGELFSSSLEEITLELKEDDVFIFFTDGITEAKNGNMEDFGMDALKDIIKNNQKLPAEDLAKKIIHEVTLFSESGTQHDDITLMILRWRKNLLSETTHHGGI
ncbi:MAG: PP2C family protein-serine/threonine phosphatase [Ignavibacteriales bacterium]|nr:MAG: PP2C family protein-serine/threonine phosphatase [Ignavibacteriales bacterium]